MLAIFIENKMVIKIEELELFDGNSYREQKETFELKKRKDGHLIKSKNRVQQHGEVFTPKWMVKKMLATPEIQEKIHDLHATFLEPSAGEGAFLTEILHQKLSYVGQISNKKDWTVNALWVLMSIYAIEYLEDNLIKAREAMMDVLVNHYQSFFQKKLSARSEFFKSAKLIINLNIVQGNTLTYETRSGNQITFNDWQKFSNDEVLRVPFTYKSLFEDEEEVQLDLFGENGQLELFGEKDNRPKRYKPVKVTKIYREELG